MIKLQIDRTDIFSQGKISGSSSYRVIDEVKTVDEFAKSLVSNNLYKESSRKSSQQNLKDDQ